MALSATALPRPLGNYTLLRRLAVGGMAEVYVAKTLGLGGFEKLVAIKVIHPRLAEDEHFVEMLIDEAKITVQLHHPNIAQIFDLGYVDGQYFIVMEYIDGIDAWKLVRKARDMKLRLPLDVCAFIVAEVCAGLDHAHHQVDNSGQPLGIVHRDISPQNVLLSHGGDVKIVDFGIAKAKMRSAETQAGVIKGKYYYMSPEQAWGDPVDHRTDVFSTGVILYELLTGEMLYKEESVPLLLDRVRKAEIEPPNLYRPELPHELSQIVMRALRPNREDRFQTASEMQQALLQFLHRESAAFDNSRLAAVIAEVIAARPSSGQLDTKKSPGPGEKINEMGKAETPAAPSTGPRIHGETKATVAALAPMRREEYARTNSVIFDDDEEPTRADVLPFFRALAAESASRGDFASQANSANVDLHDSPYDDDEDLPTRVESDSHLADRMREVMAVAQTIQGQPAAVPARPTHASPKNGSASTSAAAPRTSLTPGSEPKRFSKPAGSVRPRTSGAPGSSGHPPVSSSKSIRASKPSHVPYENVHKSGEPAHVSWPPSHSSSSVSKGLVPQPAGDDPFAPAAQPQLPTQLEDTSWPLWLKALFGFALLALGIAGWSWVATAPVTQEPAIEIVTVPPGATVLIDGQELESRSPAGTKVAPNVPHRVEVRMTGFEPWSATLDPIAAPIQQVVVLTPQAGTLSVTSDPAGAQVFVDDVLRGTSPLEIEGLPLDRSLRVRAAAPGGIAANTTVSFSNRHRLDVHLTLTPASNPPSP